jgi:hypothetical protein
VSINVKKSKNLRIIAVSLLLLANLIHGVTKPAIAKAAVLIRCGTPITQYMYAHKLSPRDLYELLKLTGFKGKALTTAWAVAMKESHGNPRDHDLNYRTYDNSYGLFQINLYGALKGRIADFNLNSASDLTDPVTNAQVAFQMSNGGKNWTAWKSNPGQRDYWLVKHYVKQEHQLI